jgi:hypothetical protein
MMCWSSTGCFPARWSGDREDDPRRRRQDANSVSDRYRRD